ncbi:MAG TPA: hypothetical protein VFF35_07585 [Bacteroidia bacterium]|nr:hypothetical protein [Bacteroidia bacterium]
MKTKLLLTILLAFVGLRINAQTTFQKTYGGSGNVIATGKLLIE